MEREIKERERERKRRRGRRKKQGNVYLILPTVVGTPRQQLERRKQHQMNKIEERRWHAPLLEPHFVVLEDGLQVHK
jgi:hypothetical protein